MEKLLPFVQLHVNVLLGMLCFVAHVVDDYTTPVTSLPCQWKRPKKPKESTLHVSKATFEKHDYAKPTKRKIKHVEDFDPRPPEFRGLAANGIPELLDKVRREQLGISLLLDPNYHQRSIESVQEPSSHCMHTYQSKPNGNNCSFQEKPSN